MPAPIRFGPQVCGSLAEARHREWLVADGLGGYAMGTVAGLRTRRYHGLLVVATRPPIGRMLGLASLDATLVLGDRRVPLATHEWASGAVAPRGHELLQSFELAEGLPRWRWAIGDVLVEREVAMLRGRPAVGVVHRVLRAPGPVTIELRALCTWRDAHGERFGDGSPAIERTPDGFVFEGAYRVRGPDFEPDGEWYRGVRYAVEAERGLNDREDLVSAGTFTATLAPGEEVGVEAWADLDAGSPPDARTMVIVARARAHDVVARSIPSDQVDASLALAADQFIVDGPTVVAGYPWFGDWSRDTMTSYEGLFLETGRVAEGRQLLERAGGLLSEGMLANTADVGGQPEFNTADGTLWFVHAVGRHVERTGDLDLAASLAEPFDQILSHHLAGTRFGIRADGDGLLAQGAEGVALTWMDARIDGRPVTPRSGKAVEVNALWIEALHTIADLRQSLGLDDERPRVLAAAATDSFLRRFVRDGRVLDVVDPDSDEVRPNQLLAASLPHGPLAGSPMVVEACRPLLTPLGLRSLSPADPSYLGRHRGGPAERDAAYHQGTVWPWLIGPYVESALKAGVSTGGGLDGLEAHLGEFGLGSVSETADGDPPHGATGCPFQAWSVAKVFRARRLLARSG
jgi:predicted glycogen debranching enzyme